MGMPQKVAEIKLNGITEWFESYLGTIGNETEILFGSIKVNNVELEKSSTGSIDGNNSYAGEAQTGAIGLGIDYNGNSATIQIILTKPESIPEGFEELYKYVDKDVLMIYADEELFSQFPLTIELTKNKE